MHIDFTITWWMVALFCLIGIPVLGLLFAAIFDDGWFMSIPGLIGFFSVFAGPLMAIAITIGHFL